jgi:hypothetical protein
VLVLVLGLGLGLGARGSGLENDDEYDDEHEHEHEHEMIVNAAHMWDRHPQIGRLSRNPLSQSRSASVIHTTRLA